MKCACGKNEATIHEIVVVDGVVQEKHLCPECAETEGISPDPHANIASLLAKHAQPSPAGPSLSGPVAPRRPPSVRSVRCSACGTTFSQFKNEGLLGCADCYKAFEFPLGPLLERAHDGATHHVGKIPRRALAASRGGDLPIEALLGSLEERAERLATLRKQIAEAVAAEHYERAARLRDELRALGSAPSSPGADLPEDRPEA